MRNSLPEAKEVLVLAPHPDDEALGCGGTITLLNKGGISSSIIFLTDGERLYEKPSPEIANIRRSEAESAAGMLGCGKVIFLGFPDGEIGGRKKEIYSSLSEIIEKKRPDIIFSPSPCDFHNDHIATAGIAMELLRNPGSFNLAFYEVYSTLRFTHLIDIAEAVDNKREAITSYRASLYERPELYVSATLGLNAHRSIFTDKNSHYEAFWIIDKPLSDQEIMEWLTYKDRDEC